MSLSATLYRVPIDNFKQLEAMDGNLSFDFSLAKSFITFEGSFEALEFILSKGQDHLTTALIKQIFNPPSALTGQYIDSLTPQQKMELYLDGSYIPYLDSTSIAQITALLDRFSADDIHLNYNAKELNEKGVYPRIWHNDNSPDKGINERQLIEDFTALTTIFKQALLDNDYLLVFVG